MRTFWLFRSNLRYLEYYHQYKDLETFKKNCHDYYMLLPLWLLENNKFDEVIIWRLTNEPRKDIVFNINGKKYIQRWVNNLAETLDYPKPDISFFRGGFREYDLVTRAKPNHFGKKIYLGAGRRIFSEWNGSYDAYLIEDERDFVNNKRCFPFYKTASSEIFYPIEGSKVKYDICWPCNFTQLKYKGQKFFITFIAKHPELQKLKIVHCGNKPDIGRKMCNQLGVDNIKFAGHITRPEMNQLLNASRFGVNFSNLIDGCPRVSTEILMSGTPLIMRHKVRLLDYFKQRGVIEIDRYSLKENILWALDNYQQLKQDVLDSIHNGISFDHINQKNLDVWKKI